MIFINTVYDKMFDLSTIIPKNFRKCLEYSKLIHNDVTLHECTTVRVVWDNRRKTNVEYLHHAYQ